MVIGKIYTFTYFEISPDGIPRHATGKSLRDDTFKWGESLIEGIRINDGKYILTLTYNGQKFECYPLCSKNNEMMYNNINAFKNKIYKYRYMVINNNNIPENPIGCGFK